MHRLNPEDFIKQKDGSEFFQSFVSKKKIPTVLGEFSLELSTEDVSSNEPSKSQLNELQSLLDRFSESQTMILDLVFKNYQKYSREPDWLDQCGVPKDLEKGQLSKFLTGQSLSVVLEFGENDEHFHSRVYVSPQWDTEHGIYFKFECDEWAQTDV